MAEGSSLKLDGRSAVITGAGRGIGRAVAERFAEEGARVALLARTAKQLEETAASVRDHGREAVVVPCDLTDAEAIEAAARRCVEAFGTIHVLVNNAGIYEGLGRAVRATVDDYDRTMAVNVRAPWLLVKQLAPHMPKDGSIIHVTSGLARGPATSYFPYSLSKWALEGLSAELAAELPQRVNVVNPGLVATEMSGFAGKEPKEVTGVFVYLASDESRVVTGQVLSASAYRNR